MLKRRLLNSEELTEIRELMNKAHWIKNQPLYLTHAQTNAEIQYGDITNRINTIIHSAMDRDSLFLNYVIPETSTYCLTSKTSKGEEFCIHVDDPFMGDFSTTVFISEPTEYSGGELILYDKGNETEFKLGAGEALTYPTGIRHRVKPVTSGERLVAVTWAKSRIRDTRIREVIWSLWNVQVLLPPVPAMISPDIAEKHPTFLINEIKNNLIREFL